MTRRFYLAALLVLFPLALWTETREDVASAWKRHAFRPVAVLPEATATFANFHWKLLSFEDRPNPKSPDQREIIVRLQVQPITEEALTTLIRCFPYLEDTSGQRWSPVPARWRDIPCRRVSREKPVMSERFIIPNARASEVQLAIIMPDERPRYLRFERPPARDALTRLDQTPPPAGRCAAVRRSPRAQGSMDCRSAAAAHPRTQTRCPANTAR